MRPADKKGRPVLFTTVRFPPGVGVNPSDRFNAPLSRCNWKLSLLPTGSECISETRGGGVRKRQHCNQRKKCQAGISHLIFCPRLKWIVFRHFPCVASAPGPAAPAGKCQGCQRGPARQRIRGGIAFGAIFGTQPAFNNTIRNAGIAHNYTWIAAVPILRKAAFRDPLALAAEREHHRFVTPRIPYCCSNAR